MKKPIPVKSVSMKMWAIRIGRTGDMARNSLFVNPMVELFNTRAKARFWALKGNKAIRVRVTVEEI
jgi:hypothetical protein